MSDRQLIAAMETVLADQAAKIQAVRKLCADRAGETHNLVPIGMVLTALGIPIDDNGNPLDAPVPYEEDARIEEALALLRRWNPYPDLNGDQFKELRDILTGAAREGA